MTTSRTTVSWIAAAEEALDLAKNANEAQREFNDLQDLVSSLATLRAEFEKLSEGAAVVRPLGWPGRLSAPDLKKDLREAVKGLGTRPLNRSVRSLDSFKSGVRASLVEFWRQYTAERMGDLAELQVLAATLSEVAGVGQLSKRLEAALGQLARNQTDFPSKRSAELLTEAEFILRQMEESLQPESVRRFLSATTRGGASLDLLSDDVMAWLRSHNASRSFKVIAGAPIDDADV
jgi:hypothetical protein